MSDWQWIDDTNPAVVYSAVLGTTHWLPRNDPEFFNETYHVNDQDATSGVSARIFLQFRGTGFALWTGGGGTTGTCSASIIPITHGIPVSFNCSNGERAKVWEMLDIPEQDYQMEIMISSDDVIEFDGVEVQNTGGNPLELKSLGFNATDVPVEAIIVDSEDPAIKYEGSWSHVSLGGAQWQSSLSRCMTSGCSFSYEFNGTGIWWYGLSLLVDGNATVVLDDGEPDIFESSQLTYERELMWSKTGLSPGKHNLNVTATEANSDLTVDFFRVLADPPDPSIETTTGPDGPGSTDGSNNSEESSSSDSISGGAIAGIVIGAILFLVGCGVAFWLWKKYKAYDKPASNQGTTVYTRAPEVYQIPQTSPSDLSQPHFIPPPYPPPRRDVEVGRMHASPTSPSTSSYQNSQST